MRLGHCSIVGGELRVVRNPGGTVDHFVIQVRSRRTNSHLPRPTDSEGRSSCARVSMQRSEQSRPSSAMPSPREVVRRDEKNGVRKTGEGSAEVGRGDRFSRDHDADQAVCLEGRDMKRGW